MLAPAPAEFRSVVVVLRVARFPRENAIIRVYHLEKSWTKAGKWSGVVVIYEILNAAEDDCMQCRSLRVGVTPGRVSGSR